MSAKSLDDQITTEFKREILRRLYDECLPRIEICLNKLSNDQIWWRPNEASNSIGNLVLHLCGNVRQWILTGIAEQPDTRKRNEEFEDDNSHTRVELWSVLTGTMADIRPVIESVSAKQLIAVKPVQVYEESVLAILVHITEHFSYHTGQIAWITKMLTGNQVGFYEGQDLG